MRQSKKYEDLVETRENNNQTLEQIVVVTRKMYQNKMARVLLQPLRVKRFGKRGERVDNITRVSAEDCVRSISTKYHKQPSPPSSHIPSTLGVGPTARGADDGRPKGVRDDVDAGTGWAWKVVGGAAGAFGSSILMETYEEKDRWDEEMESPPQVYSPSPLI